MGPLHNLFKAKRSFSSLLLCRACRVPPILKGMSLAERMLSWILFIIFLNIPHNTVLLHESEQETEPLHSLQIEQNPKHEAQLQGAFKGDVQTRCRHYLKSSLKFLKCVFMITTFWTFKGHIRGSVWK